MREYETLADAEEYLNSVPRFVQDSSPEHTAQLLERLGASTYPFRVIHVAGTNGKGSVCACLESVFRSAGTRTGLFTSPHLDHITERIRINGKEISEERFLSAFRKVMREIRKMQEEGFPHPTWFGLVFAVGMTVFCGEKIDLLVMETGLGGRLDATNALRKKDLCVITSISRDHTEHLGDTVPEIAAEKAGILRAQVPVVYDGSVPEAARIIRERAEALGAPQYAWTPDMTQITEYSGNGISFVLRNQFFDALPVSIPFPAEYQAANISVALTAARVFDREHNLPDALLQEAASSLRWPGRMEQVLPGVYLDGAHNEDGIRQFLKTVRRLSGPRPAALLFSAVKEKDHGQMVRELCSGAAYSYIVVTQVPGSRMMGAEALAELFRRLTDAPVLVCPKIGEALETALRRKGESILFCAGSLYLIGELKRRIALLKERGSIPEGAG